MTIFQTTAAQRISLAEIVVQMKRSGLDDQFIVAAQDLANVDQGMFELMDLWLAAENEADREATVADIQELLDEAEELPRHTALKPRLSFDNLDAIATEVLAHKKKIRDLIDQHGGISAVARQAGIPQPSLSRMLNSPSMPRRSTLYKIATAIGVDESAIVTDWSR